MNTNFWDSDSIIETQALVHLEHRVSDRASREADQATHHAVGAISRDQDLNKCMSNSEGLGRHDTAHVARALRAVFERADHDRVATVGILSSVDIRKTFVETNNVLLEW